MLIKYKDIEDVSENYLEAINHENPVEVIQMAKLVNSIKLGEDWYKYDSCEFIPTFDNVFIDVLHIYVDLIGDIE